MSVAPNLGTVLTTRFAVQTLALHRTFKARERAEAESQKLIWEIAWDTYRVWRLGPLALARTIMSNPVKRLKVATDGFPCIPFGLPGYNSREVAARLNTVAVDCAGCLIAEISLRHGEGALCTATWFTLDFPPEEQWGGSLERPNTIVGGYDQFGFQCYVRERSLENAE
ncbi:hypothetical protein H2509_00140 [Stappia sp. F7233]|uniref:Uncharacterized protein n=1 Tax=Stappia albiluteola TaxID=2758565 RepID=A0A839A9T1_9HYPH|nr:hypothetical protein [Stappia albiluteola]MBA5775529.1 hypothetical protein [Stappia albiluteola]